jgi:hypothetical protein
VATSPTETEPGRDHPEPLRPIRVPVGVATSRGSPGQSEVAVGTCREVVEGIVHVLELHFGLSAPKGKSLPDRARELAGRVGAAWPDDKYAGEMLSGLYGAAWSWTWSEHHYESRVSLLDEGEFAVGLTAALLTHAGHLLQTHPDAIKSRSAAEAATNGQT